MRRRQVGQQMHGCFFPSKQGCAMFVRFFAQWPRLNQAIESLGSSRLLRANVHILRCFYSFCNDHVANRGLDKVGNDDKLIVGRARADEGTSFTRTHAITAFPKIVSSHSFLFFSYNPRQSVYL